MEKLFESLFGAIFTALLGGIIGLFAAFFIIKIVKVVRERITRTNIGRLVKEALEGNQRTRNQLREAIRVAVEGKNGNTVSLSAWKNEKKVADIQLMGESVAEDIKAGDTVKLAAMPC